MLQNKNNQSNTLQWHDAYMLRNSAFHVVELDYLAPHFLLFLCRIYVVMWMVLALYIPFSFINPRVGHNEVIGVCRTGLDAEGLGRDHWNEMLAYPRKPITHWHPLVEVRKVTVSLQPGSHCYPSVSNVVSPKRSLHFIRQHSGKASLKK